MAKQDIKMYSTIFILLIIVVVIYSFKSTKMPQERSVKPEWVDTYSVLVSQDNISQENLIETSSYDYNSPLIQTKINQLLLASRSAKEYVANAAEIVYEDIDYNNLATDAQCSSGSGSKDFAVGKGDCTEQGMALITLLRGGGIPARAVGGCLSKDRSSRCNLFATISFREPRYTELTSEDLQKNNFSRKQGIGSRTGGLHLYVEAWLPSNQIKDNLILDNSKLTEHGAWVIVEPTTGQLVYKDSCFSYDQELVIPNDRKDLFCTSNNLSYALACATR